MSTCFTVYPDGVRWCHCNVHFLRIVCVHDGNRIDKPIEFVVSCWSTRLLIGGFFEWAKWLTHIRTLGLIYSGPSIALPWASLVIFTLQMTLEIDMSGVFACYGGGHGDICIQDRYITRGVYAGVAGIPLHVFIAIFVYYYRHTAPEPITRHFPPLCAQQSL